MTIVIDASIALAWSFDDERTQPVVAVLDHFHGARGVAPPLWPLEVANGLLGAVRRQRIDLARAVQLAHELQRLPIDVVDEPATIAGALADADRHGLTAYDAAYLALATARRAAIATLDTRLAAAARAVGLEVLPEPEPAEGRVR